MPSGYNQKQAKSYNDTGRGNFLVWFKCALCFCFAMARWAFISASTNQYILISATADNWSHFSSVDSLHLHQGKGLPGPLQPT